MSMTYLLSDTARESMRTGFGPSVEGYAQRVRTRDADMPYRHVMIYSDNVRRYLEEERVRLSSLRAHAPELADRYERMVRGLLSREGRDTPSWTVRRPEGDVSIFAEPEDALLLGGAWALPVLDDPTSIPDMARKLSFADPYEFLAALGLYVRERVDVATRSPSKRPELVYDRRVGNDAAFRTEISKVNHEDFTVSRKDTAPYEAVSPMSTVLRSLRPVVHADRTGIMAYQSGQYRFFSILLKWAEELGRKEEFGAYVDGLVSGYASEGVDVSAEPRHGTFERLATDTLESHVDGLPRIGREIDGYHFFSGAGRSNSAPRERAWMDTDGSLVFDVAEQLHAPFAQECLRLHPDELLSLVRAVFAFEYQATGGASLLLLPQMLAYYRGQEFAEMVETYRRD